MSQIVDDKSEHCIPFILEHIKKHQESCKASGKTPPPFFIGINGVQGAGKTTLVSALCNTLRSPPYSLETVVLSIDDLYLPHKDQVALANSHPDNALVQHRGQPSTHDVQLGVDVFAAIKERRPNIKIPMYDKSAFQGQGDRVDESHWPVINTEPSGKSVEVVIFEGWCVGFRPLEPEDLKRTWNNAKDEAEGFGEQYKGKLGRHAFEHVKFINDALREYDQMTNQLDVLIHIDAYDTMYVYRWRMEQEAALRKSKGTGMTDEQVLAFVDGYYPAYELYGHKLRSGVYSEKGKQLRLIVGEDRRVKEVYKM